LVRAQERELIKYHLQIVSGIFFALKSTSSIKIRMLINNHIVYILRSEKLNRYYTGYTSNFDLRLEFHKNAPSNKFTSNADD